MKLKKSEVAAVKRAAATVEPYLKKKERILKKINELTKQLDENDDDIRVWEQGVRNLTGYGVEEIVEKVVVNGVTRFKIREDMLEEEREQEAPLITVVPYVDDSEIPTTQGPEEGFEINNEENRIF